MKHPSLPLASLIFVSLAGCAGGIKQPERFESGGAPVTAEDAGDVAQGDAGSDRSGEKCANTLSLIKEKCASCHSAANPSASLDLESKDIGSRLTDVPATAACAGYSLIDSADPARSLLYLKVTASSPCASPMPLGEPLSERDQQCLLAWIEQL